MIDRFLRWLLYKSVTDGGRLSEWAAMRAADRVQKARPHTFTANVELTALLRLAHCIPDGSCILEIGSYLGASARVLGVAARHRKAPLVCVDTWGNETMPDGLRDTHAEFQRNTAGFAKEIRMVRKASKDLVAADVPCPIGLAFIDGDHSYESCKNDWNVLQPMLHQDAVVAFHDSTGFAGVGRALGEVLASGKWAIAGNVLSLTWVRRANWHFA